jgi:hypothetical protein
MVDTLDEPDRRPGRHQHVAHVRGRARTRVKVILSGMGATSSAATAADGLPMASRYSAIPALPRAYLRLP